MLTLYGNLESGNVYKVRLLLAHLQIPHHRIDVAQTRGEPRSAKFRAINPIGKIPAVRFDDGRVLSESGAILYYLAQGTSYFPEEAFDAASVLRWMFFEQYSHEPYIAGNRYVLQFATDAERADMLERVPGNRAKGEHALSVMEQHLREHEWLAASHYTIADIALFAYTHNADEAGFDLINFPATRAWLDRVRCQPRHIRQMEESSVAPPTMFSAG